MQKKMNAWIEENGKSLDDLDPDIDMTLKH